MDQVQGKQVNPDFKDQTLYAKVKHFRIEHPLYANLTLTHSCLEGPENAVYCRGYAKDTNYVVLPSYWMKLVADDSITVHVTPAGNYSNLSVQSVGLAGFAVGGSHLPSFFWIAYGTRKDILPLKVVEVKEEEPSKKDGSRFEKWWAKWKRVAYMMHR